MSATRKPGRNFLFVPGPTNVPDRILRAMHVAMEDHRSSDFPKLTMPLYERMKKIFKTREGQVVIFPSSGTGAWESALTNTLAPGDTVLASRFGQFSHLWSELAKRHGLNVIVQDEEWGTGANPDRIEEALRADKTHEIKGVLVVHNETATGVTSNVAAVRRALDAAKHPAHALCRRRLLDRQHRLPLRRLGRRPRHHRLAEGPHASRRPRHRLRQQDGARGDEGRQSRHAYFDIPDQMRANATGYFPYTPALPMLYGLREALDIIDEEGLENVIARHHHLAGGARAAVEAWGLKLCAKEPKWHSDTVTAIMVPAGFNGADVIDVAYRRYNLALGAGLSQVAGKLFRIGHLGDLNELMLLGAIAGAEMAMRDTGIEVDLGSGVAAAQAHFRDGMQAKIKQVAAE